jgi:chemotaxis signal transduction protein
LNAENLIKVLTIPYSTMDFLINRDQCSTSVYIAEVSSRETGSPYLHEALKLQDRMIPLFDLDLFFRDFFKQEATGAAHLALIRNRETLSQEILSKLESREKLFYGDEETRAEQIAFRVASATKMTEIRLPELRLQPAVSARYLEERGVLAVTFSTGRKMGCMIDLDILFKDEILTAGRRDDENTDS